jgi:hypothetical protein
MTKFMKIIKYIFEKDSPMKLLISLFVVVTCLVCINLLDEGSMFFVIVGAPFALWVVLFALILIVYAWIINPITFLIKKFKK